MFVPPPARYGRSAHSVQFSRLASVLSATVAFCPGKSTCRSPQKLPLQSLGDLQCLFHKVLGMGVLGKLSLGCGGVVFRPTLPLSTPLQHAGKLFHLSVYPDASVATRLWHSVEPGPRFSACLTSAGADAWPRLILRQGLHPERWGLFACRRLRNTVSMRGMSGEAPRAFVSRHKQRI